MGPDERGFVPENQNLNGVFPPPGKPAAVVKVARRRGEAGAAYRQLTVTVMSVSTAILMSWFAV
jgi:hypothetical protein